MTLRAEPDASEMRLRAVADAAGPSRVPILPLEAALAAAEIKIAHLERALVTNRITSAAVGILMAKYGLSYEQTFAMLRELSQTTNCKLFAVAEVVLATGDLPPAITEDYARICRRRTARAAEGIDDDELDGRRARRTSRSA